MEDGSMKPIAYASRSLNPAEKRYSQLDKEGLAIVVGVKKFHHYLFGRKFTICSNHKPLQHLFSESRPIPQMASARIQHWALTLSAYDYNIVYRPGTEMANADLLSRLPLLEAPASVPLPGETIPFLGKMFLIVVDAHSEWLEVEIVTAATSAHTIQKLRAMFATHGLPEMLVSDNGTAFTSAEFQEFLSNNGVRHLTSAPYYPSSNGLAERAVQTLKSYMKKGSDDDVQKQLFRFLFRY